jgi:steroid delta-isomerase-like uncharacterized protein
MTRDEITTFFERREQAWKSGDVATLTTGHSEAGIVISPIFGTVNGRPAIEKTYRDLFTKFQDWEYENEAPICEGNRAALSFMFRATHSSDFFGVPPTGRRFEIHGVNVYTLDRAHISHERRIYDFTALLFQIGVLKAKPK